MVCVSCVERLVTNDIQSNHINFGALRDRISKVADADWAAFVDYVILRLLASA